MIAVAELFSRGSRWVIGFRDRIVSHRLGCTCRILRIIQSATACLLAAFCVQHEKAHGPRSVHRGPIFFAAFFRLPLLERRGNDHIIRRAWVAGPFAVRVMTQLGLTCPCRLDDASVLAVLALLCLVRRLNRSACSRSPRTTRRLCTWVTFRRMWRRLFCSRSSAR